MKKLQRLFAVLLAVAMVASLVACGNGESADPTQGADPTKAATQAADPTKAADPTEGADPTATPEPTEALGYGGIEIIKDKDGNVVDLGGVHVIVGDYWYAPKAEDKMTAQDEATEEYLDWCQETYNFTIERKAVSDWGECGNYFTELATAGTEDLIVMAVKHPSAPAPIKSGLAYDLATLDCIDFTEDKWVQSSIADATFGNSTYGCCFGSTEPRNGVWFNKRLLKEAGIDPQSLYEMQESMTWDWAAFEEICKATTRDIDNDGVYDTYALADSNSALYQAAIASNGSFMFGKDANGKFYNNTLSDDYLEAINWAIGLEKLYKKPAPVTFDADGNEVAAAWDWFYASFINGEIALQVDNEYRCSNMTDAGMADDFGFVCFPMGPNMDDYTNVVSDNVWMIPNCYDADTAWKIAFAFDLYTDLTPGYDDPLSAIIESRYEKYCDTEGLDLTYRRMVDNATTWCTDWIPGLDLGPQYWWTLGSQTPAEAAEAMKTTWDALIEEANAK